MQIGLCYTLITPENKMLLQAAQKRGVELVRVLDSQAVLKLTNGAAPEFRNLTWIQGTRP